MYRFAYSLSLGSNSPMELYYFHTMSALYSKNIDYFINGNGIIIANLPHGL